MAVSVTLLFFTFDAVTAPEVDAVGVSQDMDAFGSIDQAPNGKDSSFGAILAKAAICNARSQMLRPETEAARVSFMTEPRQCAGAI